MDERVDILDELGNLTGRVAWKSEAHRRGLWHRCFHCWICGVDASGEPYLLLQRRARTKDTWPGRLDVTAAGHLAAGEETLDGLRELEEELGLRADPERLVPLGSRRVEQEIPGGCDREFHEVFLLLDHTPPQDMRLQREEVEAVLRIRLDDAAALGSHGSTPALEYAQGRVSVREVRASDFVPGNRNSLGRVARAARSLLSGESPGEVFQPFDSPI